MSDSIFKPEIIQYIDSIMETFTETADLFGVDFFKEEFTDPENGKDVFKQLVGNTATKNFLDRDDGNFQLTEEQIERCMQESVIRAAMNSLRAKGLVDWIENESGTEMVFVTEKGRQLGTSLFGHETENSHETESK